MDLLANLLKLPFWIDCASVVMIAAGVAKAFEWFDGLISDNSRIALWIYLEDVPNRNLIDSWVTVFSSLIDRVFGARALSWKFIMRSVISSVLAVLIVFALSYRVNLGRMNFLGDGFWGSLYDEAFLFAQVNCIPDYLSLILSRTIVRSMAKNFTILRIILLLLLDTVLTFVLAVGSYLFANSSWLDLYFHIPGAFDRHYLARLTRELMILRAPGGVLIYAAFFTSVWVWLYVLSIFFIKAAQKIRPLWLKLLPYLDIEKKPMQAIGRIAGIMAGAEYAAILLLVWVSKHWS